MGVPSLSRRERAKIDWAFLRAVHSIEPELHAATPRRVARRASKRRDPLARLSHLVLGGALIFTLVLGALLGLWAGFAALIFPLGATTTATVLAHERTPGGESELDGGASTLLHFEFWDAKHARLYRGTWPVSDAVAAALPDGSTTPARYFPFAPGVRPLLATGDSPWAHIIVMGTMGLLMLAIGGVPLRAFFPRMGVNPVKNGVPTVGVVVARQGDCATLWFQVSDERGQTRVLESSQIVSPTFWESHAVGAPITVLHQARPPHRALVYADGDWIALA